MRSLIYEKFYRHGRCDEEVEYMLSGFDASETSIILVLLPLLGFGFYMIYLVVRALRG